MTKTIQFKSVASSFHFKEYLLFSIALAIPIAAFCGSNYTCWAIYFAGCVVFTLLNWQLTWRFSPRLRKGDIIMFPGGSKGVITKSRFGKATVEPYK